MLVSCYQKNNGFLLTVFKYLFRYVLSFFKQVFIQVFLLSFWLFKALYTENLDTNKHNYKYNNT